MRKSPPPFARDFLAAADREANHNLDRTFVELRSIFHHGTELKAGSEGEKKPKNTAVRSLTPDERRRGRQDTPHDNTTAKTTKNMGV